MHLLIKFIELHIHIGLYFKDIYDARLSKKLFRQVEKKYGILKN